MDEGNCVFLIGAGFSKSAGISMARVLMFEIKQKYPRDCNRAGDKDNLGKENS
jgi:NAD-dependent SIR2 family protein deacetylase